MHDELTAYIRAQFKTATALAAYLNDNVWPLYKAERFAAQRAFEDEREMERQRTREQRESVRAARIERQREETRQKRLADKLALEQAHTAELAARAQARRQARVGAAGPPNARFCDLDNSPLSDRQVVMRANRGESVKEIKTGRIMCFQEGQYKKGQGKWIEVQSS